MNAPASALTAVPWLLALSAMRDRALAADSINALAFSIANDPHPLLRYYQALVFAAPGVRPRLLAVSGLAMPEEASPYLVWLEGASRWLQGVMDTPEPRLLERGALPVPDDLQEGWSEWWPDAVWCVPLHGREGQRLGLAVFLFEQPPETALLAQLQPVVQTWAYCWQALAPPPRRRRWLPSRRQRWIAGAAVVAVMLLPVRQTALAPAEIVSRNGQVVSAPLDGVIAELQVRPNQRVRRDQPLLRLDETTLRNRAEVLRQQVAVADAELMAASQSAFDNPQSRSELLLLTGRSQQQRAELAAVEAQLQRTEVRAPRDGVAVFADPNEWIGRPVNTGERILLLADPQRPAMQIELPAADAIALETGAKVTLYLSAYPLRPLHGRVLETSYQARPSDDNVVSYRLIASIDDAPVKARLGLHGTAKIYGDRVLLGYYLLRRPIAAFRGWSGL
ncbi:efflux RND transporter periplasmic adaptor subunit [Stenotrophomonas sp. NPDC077464]|uniref:efflux RND transporter periplasmic adaptor subunit n=1 Tax=unclassified Stenotrophomonas TaxID=196198 RepID=UPI0037CDDB9A